MNKFSKILILFMVPFAVACGGRVDTGQTEPQDGFDDPTTETDGDFSAAPLPSGDPMGAGGSDNGVDDADAGDITASGGSTNIGAGGATATGGTPSFGGSAGLGEVGQGAEGDIDAGSDPIVEPIEVTDGGVNPLPENDAGPAVETDTGSGCTPELSVLVSGYAQGSYTPGDNIQLFFMELSVSGCGAVTVSEIESYISASIYESWQYDRRPSCWFGCDQPEDYNIRNFMLTDGTRENVLVGPSDPVQGPPAEPVLFYLDGPLTLNAGESRTVFVQATIADPLVTYVNDAVYFSVLKSITAISASDTTVPAHVTITDRREQLDYFTIAGPACTGTMTAEMLSATSVLENRGATDPQLLAAFAVHGGPVYGIGFTVISSAGVSLENFVLDLNSTPAATSCLVRVGDPYLYQDMRGEWVNKYEVRCLMNNPIAVDGDTLILRGTSSGVMSGSWVSTWFNHAISQPTFCEELPSNSHIVSN